MKILITGGHFTPSLAVIESIKHMLPIWDIVYVGRDVSIEESQVQSEEKRIISEYKIKFIPLITGRITRIFTKTSIISFLKIPIGFFQAVLIIIREKPSVILTFGGYIGLPISIVGYLFRIPIFLHEQTAKPGLTSQIVSIFSKTVFVQFKEAQSYFKDNTLLVGLPIRKKIFQIENQKNINIPLDKPIIYIAGGSTGAVTMNEIIFQFIADLSLSFTIVHQTGKISFGKAKQVKKSLPKKLTNRYFPYTYVDIELLSWLYQNIILYIGRSGANTVGELCALGKIAIFVPLPWSARNEQEENAKILVKNGSAIIIPQKNLSQESLLSTIRKILSTDSDYKSAAKRMSNSIPRNASEIIIQEIQEYIYDNPNHNP